MNIVDFLTDDTLIMTITSNFRKDFKKLNMSFNYDLGYDLEFPELNFVYKSFKNTDSNVKRTIFACTKIKFIFDMERGEKYVVAYPMINIYPTIIAEHIKKFNFKNEKAAFIYFARITLMHELVHYLQLCDKVFFSKILKKDYDKFGDKCMGEVIEKLEEICTSELTNILNKHYSTDEVLIQLGIIEILDYRYLFNKIEFDEYEEKMSMILEKIDKLLL